jgi:hypothetical protein
MSNAAMQQEEQKLNIVILTDETKPEVNIS